MQQEIPAGDALPSRIFIPVFAVLGVAVICAIIALIILLRRDSREHLSRRARRALRGASHIFTFDSSRNACKKTGGMSKATIEELQFHLPTNQMRPAPLSRTASLALPDRPKQTSRPNTANSAFSETFIRPLPWRTKRQAIMQEASRTSTPTFWVEEEDKLEPKEKDDIEWRPPNEWDVVGPVGSNINIPVVPIPAFLKPPVLVDPRTIDPSNFPLPYQATAEAAGRWSSSQTSTAQGHRFSSVAGNSVFCTCDLDDIAEEQPGPSYQQNGEGRLSPSGSSIYIRTGRCRACMKKSAMTNAPANGSSAPPTPVIPSFSRNSSMGKPRRKRRQEVTPRTKIAVAGRLYQSE